MIRIRFAPTICVVAVLSMLVASPLQGQYDNWSEDQDDNDSDLTAFAVIVGAIAATTPFWLPIAATHDENSEPGYFAEYPYKHGKSGNMLIGDSLRSDSYNWAFQAKTAYAESFGRFRRIDAGLQLEGTHRFGIDAEFDYWRESVVSGQRHSFWTGDANLMFRFAQSEWLQTRVGLGGNWLEDDANSDYGFNFTYKADLFVRDPLILSGELDWGTLGDETLFHPRITLGAQWHRAELFIGADYFDIGPTQATSMIAGGRFWY